MKSDWKKGGDWRDPYPVERHRVSYGTLRGEVLSKQFRSVFAGQLNRCFRDQIRQKCCNPRGAVPAQAFSVPNCTRVMLRRIDVTAFVDWRAQIANAGQNLESRANRKAERTADFVTGAIALALSTTRRAELFRVKVRLYHGWHKALTPTENRRALDALLSERLLRRIAANVTFDWSRGFGDTLLDAYEHRRHPRLRIHLPDTLRDDLEADGPRREKMVDTAIACDVLYSARTTPQDWRLVLAEDDDLVPAVFVAEKWSKEKGGRTVLLRTRAGFGHLALDGLVWEINRRS